jgi:hypothetical protein
MPHVQNILAKLPPYSGRRMVYQKHQGVSDVIAGMGATHQKYKSQYDTIAGQFMAPTALQSCRLLWDFLKNNTHYIIEPDSEQTLRSPAAILELGKNSNVGLDCKSYSLFIGGILDALNRKGKNIPWCYRYASYRWYDPMPHHVFVVAFPGTNREIWIDPVLSSFNEKKKYYFKTDRKMALVGISGVNRRQKRQAKKAARKQQPRRKKIMSAIKNKKKFLVRFNPVGAAGRNAFLLIVKLNVFNLARRLNVLNQKNPNKLKSFWEKIGGNYSNLLNNINIGSKAKKSATAQQSTSMTAQRSNIGFVEAGVAVTTATPIIVKVIKLLKDAGIGTEDLMAVAKNVAKKVIMRQAQTTETPSEAAQDQINSNMEELGEESTSAAESMQQTAANIEEATEDNEQDSEQPEEGVGSINIQNMLPLAAIAAGIYFLSRKR